MTKYFLRMNVPVSCVRHALYLPVNLANYFMRLVSALLHLPGRKAKFLIFRSVD